MGTLSVRNAAAPDLPALLGLYRQLSPDDPPVAPEIARANLDALLASPLTHVLVANAGDALAGTCLLVIVPNLTRGGRSFAIIENVVAHEDWRRQGVGTRLIETACARAWAAGCYKIMLASGRRDEGVMHFYEKVGFTRGTKTFFEMRRRD